jgi:hypothetical protein
VSRPRGRLAIALALLLAAPALAATPPAKGARAIAFLGLRPATDATLGQTAITQLAEAQRLRTLAENVVEVVTGATVLRHEELRAALGRTYLVELFDCRGDAACQLRVAAPLARQGIVTAVVGDYAADGAVLRIRMRRLDLAGGRVAGEATFAPAKAAAETLEPWQEALRPLFQDTGTLRVVANVEDAACTIDRRPCEPAADGSITIEEGEHVLELSKEGYRRASRVVTVARGVEQRVAVALEELPVQVQKAPDPTARLPTFEPPTDKTQVKPFGSIRLAVLVDDVNLGDREDIVVPPRGTPREGSVVFFPRPAVLGAALQAPRSESGWELRGGLGIGWVRGDLPEFDSAFVELVKPEAGFKLMLGWGPSIVSGLTAGTLTIPEGFGDLNPGLIGITASQSIGPVVVEAFVGKQKSMFNAEAEEGAAAPLPFLAGRLAFVDEEHEGRLYGDDYPLTLSVSGLWGQERVGLAAEQEWVAGVNDAGASPAWAAPRVQDLPVWAGSVELFVPFGKVASFAGEAYYGQSAHRLEGALWQVPRYDPVSGRHRPLRSAGGWAQLAGSPIDGFELRLIAGIDRVVDGLAFGVAPGGAPGIRENRLAAAAAVWYLLGHLTLGIQLHAVQTVYDDPALGSPNVVGTALTSRLTF